VSTREEYDTLLSETDKYEVEHKGKLFPTKILASVVAATVVSVVMGLSGFLYGLGVSTSTEHLQVSLLQDQVRTQQTRLDREYVTKEEFLQFVGSLNELRKDFKDLSSELHKTRETLARIR